jgi:hypothetical protein
MTELPDDFAQRLLGADRPAPPASVAALQQEIDAMIERKLSPAQRRVSAVMGLAALGAAGWYVVLLARHAQPPLLAGVLVTGLATCATLGAVLVWVAAAGAFRRRPHGEMFAAAGMVALGGLGLVFLRAGWNEPGSPFTFVAVACLVLFGGFVLIHEVESASLRTRRKLLEIELRLAELSEQLARFEQRRQPGGP